MKKMRQRILLPVITAMAVSAAMPVTAFAADAVARIGTATYDTLDAAIAAAKDGETIEVLRDAETAGLNLRKDLTIKGVSETGKKPTVNFADKGIALWGIDLTFTNCDVVMDGITSTPYTGEWSWMAICASRDATLTLNNVNMTLDADPDGSVRSGNHAIYFCGNNKLNLNNSTLAIYDYIHDALEWDKGDGGYNVNITDSTFISDNNRSGFTGTFYATIKNSDVDVINSAGNGSNGSHFIIEDSNVNFSDNGSHGLSAGNMIIKNSVVNAINNGYYGITYNSNMTMDGDSVINAVGNGTGYTGGGLRAASSSGTTTVESGAEINILDNQHNGLENYGTFTAADGAYVTVTGNDERSSNGGGIYNGSAGVLTLPKDTIITENHAKQTGGGICNAGTINLASGVQLYNNHADEAGDDVYNRENATFNGLPGIESLDWVLDGEPDCEHYIDGWYADANGARWNVEVNGAFCSTDDQQETNVDKLEETVLEGLAALKAAHGNEGIVDKTSYPGLDKTILEDGEKLDETSVAAGDTVKFELTSNVPQDLKNYLEPDEPATPSIMTMAFDDEKNSGTYKLTFHDEMAEELFLDRESIAVEIEGKEVEAQYLDISVPGDRDGCTFEVAMDLVELYKAGYFTEEEFGEAEIVVSYSAQVSGKIKPGEYKNTAWVEYEGDESKKDTVTVDTYGINIFKYDQETQKGLEGAKFELYQKDSEGSPIQESVISLESGKDGTVVYEGLKAGTYYLKETAAPEGYVCSDSELTIEIPEKAGTDYMVKVQFANSLIPHTGGSGTRMFTYGGAAVIAAAGVLLVVSRRKKDEK